jgi:hypothetical protein
VAAWLVVAACIAHEKTREKEGLKFKCVVVEQRERKQVGQLGTHTTSIGRQTVGQIYH